MNRSIHDHIQARIRAKPRGSVFVPTDFLDLGGRAAVDQTLSRLTRSRVLRRVARGVYDRPKLNPRLGMLSPSLPDVAAALARSTGSQLQVSRATAANQLGISTQVPAQLCYLTDGTSRTIRVGNQAIDFRRASPRILAGAGGAAGLVLQALRYFGRDGITDDVVNRIRGALAPTDRAAVRKYIKKAPTWMHPALRLIAATAEVASAA